MQRHNKYVAMVWTVGLLVVALSLAGCSDFAMLIEEQEKGSRAEFSVVLPEVQADMQFGPNYGRDFPEMLSAPALAPAAAVEMKWGPTYHTDDPALIENRVQMPASTTVDEKWGPRYDIDDPSLVTG